MAKNLELTVTLKGSQATAALKGIRTALKENEQAFKSMQTAQKKAVTGINESKEAATKAAAAVKTYGSVSLTAGKTIEKAFSGIGTVISTTTSQLTKLIRYTTTFASVTGGILIKQAISNFMEFDNQLRLMNATLGSSDASTIDEISKSLYNLSSKTGTDIIDLTDALTQFYSSGLNPRDKAVEGTAEYSKALGDTTKILEMTAVAAKATGESVGEMGEAMVFAANSLGLDAGNVADAQLVFELFGSTLDNGIGLMKEYSGQFQKFSKDAINAGASQAQTLALFARLTKTQSAEYAGFRSRAFFSFLNNLDRNAIQAANRINMVKKKLGSTFSADDLNIINKFDTAAEWKALTINADGTKKSITEIISNFKQVTDLAERGTDVFDLLTAAIAGEKNVQFVLKDILSDEGYADFIQIENNINDVIERGQSARDDYANTLEKLNYQLQIGAISQSRYATEYQKAVDLFDKETADSLINTKYGAVMSSLGEKWNQLVNTVSSQSRQLVSAMAPGLGAVMTLLQSVALGSEKMSRESLAEAFTQSRKKLLEFAPAFLPVLNMIEKFAEALRQGKAEETLSDVLEIVSGIGRAFVFVHDALTTLWNSAPVQWIRDLQVNPLLKLTIGLASFNAFKLAMAGVGALLGRSAISYISGSVATAVAGRALAGGFAANLGAVGAWATFIRLLGLTTTWATAAAVIAGAVALSWSKVMNERQERSAKVVETADMTTRMAKAGTLLAKGDVTALDDMEAVKGLFNAKNTAYTVKPNGADYLWATKELGLKSTGDVDSFFTDLTANKLIAQLGSSEKADEFLTKLQERLNGVDGLNAADMRLMATSMKGEIRMSDLMEKAGFINYNQVEKAAEARKNVNSSLAEGDLTKAAFWSNTFRNFVTNTSLSKVIPLATEYDAAQQRQTTLPDQIDATQAALDSAIASGDINAINEQRDKLAQLQTSMDETQKEIATIESDATFSKENGVKIHDAITGLREDLAGGKIKATIERIVIDGVVYEKSGEDDSFKKTSLTASGVFGAAVSAISQKASFSQ